MACRLTEEPDSTCTNAEHWIKWSEICARDGFNDYGEDMGVDFDEFFHDSIQATMWQIEDKHTCEEVARRTGVPIEPSRRRAFR